MPAYPRDGYMRNSVWYNGGDHIDQLAKEGARFHSQLSCRRSEACVIHNPSDHQMRRWPRNLRASALVERMCVHGVGHPDPDSVAFFDSIGRRGFDVHGCDGCCTLPVAREAKTIIVLDSDQTIRTVTLDEKGRVTISGGPISRALLAAALDQLDG